MGTSTCTAMGGAYGKTKRILPSPQERLQEHLNLHAGYTSRCMDLVEAFVTSIYLENNLTERTSFVEIETQDPEYGTLATRGPVAPYELPLRPGTRAFPPNRLLCIKG